MWTLRPRVLWDRGINTTATGEHISSRGGHCPQCNRAVDPIRPPIPARRWAVWVGVSVTAAALLIGIVLWAVIGIILWRNSKAICPECGYDPIKGNVGWTAESVILWILLVGCVMVSLWATFWFLLSVMWMMWLFAPFFG